MSRRPTGRRQALYAVVGVTVVALLARFFALGFRVAHWDEARVGYWTLRYLDSGIWEYRAIMHGPLLFHFNKYLFGLAGVSDFNARLLVALVGGLLPLSAWLFRDRLRDIEMVAVAAFLALNPILLYYSRFMRNDVLVAAFALFALGFFVRLIDTGQYRYLFAGVFALALGFAAKEIIVVYLAIWVGAAALLLDHRLFTASERDERWQNVALGYGRLLYARLRRHWGYFALALLEFLVLVVLFYAPRPDLYQALGNPAMLPGVIEEATMGSWEKLESLWISGGHEHSYVAFLVDALETTAYTSLPLSAFAVLGFLADRYADREPRDLVSFAFYWGLVVFLAYPAITDISAAWSLVHAMVPLAIPAAVGIGLVVDRGLEAQESEDWISVGLAGLVVLAVVAQVGITGIQTSYRNPQDDTNPLVQYGQPAGHMQETFEDIEAVSRANEGTDVLFYGDHFYLADESAKEQFPSSGNWLNRMPLSWYLERADAEVDSTTQADVVEDGPPVVIARAEHYSTLEPRLQGYEALTYEITATNTETVFFIKTSALEQATE